MHPDIAKTPIGRFRSHMDSAARRGLPFTLTLAQWWEHWKNDFHQRGTHRGEKNMCRSYDKGGYEQGNVRIDTVEGNRAEREWMSKITEVGAPKRQASNGARLLQQKSIYCRNPADLLAAAEPALPGHKGSISWRKKLDKERRLQLRERRRRQRVQKLRSQMDAFRRPILKLSKPSS